jgi:hypothetical protein
MHPFLALARLILYELLKVYAFYRLQQIGNQLFQVHLFDPINAVESYDELPAESKHEYLELHNLM